jgi:hypothetical protein
MSQATDTDVTVDNYEGIKIVVFYLEDHECYYVNVSGKGLEDSKYNFETRAAALAWGKELIDEYLTPYEDEYLGDEDDDNEDDENVDDDSIELTETEIESMSDEEYYREFGEYANQDEDEF